MTEQIFDRAQFAANVENGIHVVERITAALGYRGVTLADLTLSADEVAKMSYIKKLTGSLKTTLTAPNYQSPKS